MLPVRLRNRHLLAADTVSSIVSPLLAFAIRFEDANWIVANPRMVLPYLFATVPLRLAVFYGLGLYRRLWRHASSRELNRILAAGALGAAMCAIVGLVVLPQLHIAPSRVPFSVLFIDAVLTCAAIGLPRLLARTVRPHYQRRRDDPGKPVLIVGAGDTGKLVVKELYTSPQLGYEPVGFVDDDTTKHRHVLYGLPVFGGLSKTREIIERYRIAKLIIAMPSAPGAVVRQIVRTALDAGITTLTVPSLPELIAQRGEKTGLREVEIQDLLRREPVQTDLAAVSALATGETVLVTGAGGSIGSELCRQLARLAPARMVLLGHGENSIFDIQAELKRSFPEIRFVPIIADIRDRERISGILRRCKPHALFHAAAHKHVPLMEDNAIEAITNNIAGTKNVVDAAIASGVQHFVLVSTDKAVRPTSVMGASKRVAEQIVQIAAEKHDRNFVSVRFGNVLGSRGSVVPTFMQQIRVGGPVTVTHPEMQRYFMTIPEAVQLVLQAGALGAGGEVFLLDMGEPVRVIDLATDLIRLSGLTVGTDIEIEFTGIRSGEKLYEEMFFSAENAVPTVHPKVLRARCGILPDGVMRRIESLVSAARESRPDEELKEWLHALVPDFRPHGTALSDSESTIPMTSEIQRPQSVGSASRIRDLSSLA